MTAQGKTCRNWAISGQREGPALCSIHAGLSRLPGPDDEAAGRRCTALTSAGKQCWHWAKKDSVALYGKPLCAAHLGEIRWPMPGPLERAEGRQCTATTKGGKRCAHWKKAGTDPPLCWMHANPDKHPQLRHGYFQVSPLFGEAERAAVNLLRESGRLLDAEILVTRLRIHALAGYLNTSDRPFTENVNSVHLIIRSCNRLVKLLLARNALATTMQPDEEPDPGPA